MQTCQIGVSGLSVATAKDLAARLSSVSWVDEQEEPPSDYFVEPIVTVLVVATPAAIGVIGAWMMKRREHETYDYEFERIEPNGSATRMCLHVSKAQSTSPDKDVISKLADMAKLDPAECLKAIQSSNSSNAQDTGG